jgi:dihydrofolate synthase/folylpolyglutamate synthase
LRRFGREFKIRRTGLRSFDYEGVHRRIADIVLSMPGAHQFKNAALAVATIESLGEKGFAVSDEEIRRAVHATRFPGRFETLAENPTVIIDGAHTPEGMRMLRSTFRSMYPGESPLFLLGVLQDKRYEEMIRIAASFARRMICAPPQGYRALDPEHAASLARSHGIPATAAVSIEDGFRILRSEAGETDRIIAAGSLYMIGPVRSACGVGDE